jgi:hypothetical protein
MIPRISGRSQSDLSGALAPFRDRRRAAPDAFHLSVQPPSPRPYTHTGCNRTEPNGASADGTLQLRDAVPPDRLRPRCPTRGTSRHPPSRRPPVCYVSARGRHDRGVSIRVPGHAVAACFLHRPSEPAAPVLGWVEDKPEKHPQGFRNDRISRHNNDLTLVGPMSNETGGRTGASGSSGCPEMGPPTALEKRRVLNEVKNSPCSPQRLTFPDAIRPERCIGSWVVFGRILNQPHVPRHRSRFHRCPRHL